MTASWQALGEAIASCTACGLHASAMHRVEGQGNPNADLMLIGEGPGVTEDRTGLAFVGPAGELLTRMLASIAVKREDVYICNVVKCHPPGNRTPTPAECASCLTHLRAQFALVRPKIILLLGATALQAVLSPQMRITRARGLWVERKGVWFMPTYHPAALLRTPDKKKESRLDLLALAEKMDALNIPRG